MQKKSKITKKQKSKTIDIVYIGLFAALIAACAQISIPLTVPITLQTMGVCLTAGLLGHKRGILAVIIYIIIGGIGIPVFSNFKGGIGVLFGSTGGYIIGFIFTALIVGIITEKTGQKIWALILSMIFGVAVCYVFGTIWFMVLYKKGNSDPASLTAVLGWCVTPFLIPDAVKIVLSALLVNRLKKFMK